MRLTVTGGPQRLDRFLVAAWPGEPVGRRRLAAVLAHGDLRVNGRPARKGTLVRAGDEVTLRMPAAPPQRLVPTPGRLRVLHRDAALVAIDKPPGVPTLGGPTPGPSVAAILLDAFPEMERIDPRRAAGLAHRLDTGTSGILIAARTRTAYARLRAEFQGKAIEKHYLAVVHGCLSASFTIANPLRRHARRRGRMLVARAGDPRAWPATTYVAPVCSARALTLVHLRMRTGVTHQLRVHLAASGHPILGDARYALRGRSGAPAHPDDATRSPSPAAPWHYLHAVALRFDAPDLPRRLATRFPPHWVPLFRELGWPTRLTALLGPALGDPAGAPGESRTPR